MKSLYVLQFLLIFSSVVPDVLRYVHPLYQTGAVNATDREAVWLARIPAQLTSARAASTPVSPSWPCLSGWLPPLVLRFLPGPLRVSPSTYSSGEERWGCPVGAEHGEGEAEGKQPAGMSTLRYTNSGTCVALGYFHIMFADTQSNHSECLNNLACPFIVGFINMSAILFLTLHWILV